MIIIKFVVPILCVLFWAFLYFLGYFGVLNPWYWIGLIAITTLGYFCIRRIFKTRIALLFVLITIALSLFSGFSGFEEQYCFGQGHKADPTGKVLISPSKEDLQILTEYQIGTSAGGLAFLTHMKCHTKFSFTTALWSLIKKY